MINPLDNLTPRVESSKTSRMDAVEERKQTRNDAMFRLVMTVGAVGFLSSHGEATTAIVAIMTMVKGPEIVRFAGKTALNAIRFTQKLAFAMVGSGVDLAHKRVESARTRIDYLSTKKLEATDAARLIIFQATQNALNNAISRLNQKILKINRDLVPAVDEYITSLEEEIETQKRIIENLLDQISINNADYEKLFEAGKTWVAGQEVAILRLRLLQATMQNGFSLETATQLVDRQLSSTQQDPIINEILNAIFAEPIKDATVRTRQFVMDRKRDRFVHQQEKKLKI